MPDLTATQRLHVIEAARAHLAVLAAEEHLIHERSVRREAERLLTTTGIDRKLRRPVTVNVERRAPLVTLQYKVDTFEYSTSEAI